MSDEPPRKLIEVALPLEAINRESARENYIYRGNPSAAHKWWAQRPLAAARAVLFASLVDDPSARPEDFPDEQSQAAERHRLFQIIGKLVKWENRANEQVLEMAREEIDRAFREDELPIVIDPFCGAGSIPLEAQRLGLSAYASDLNPVAVLMTKALIELPGRWAGRAPVHPQEGQLEATSDWDGVKGLAEDVRYYGAWLRERAFNAVGHLWISDAERESDEPLAWLWTRTVQCPNPACRRTMPLLTTLIVSSKRDQEVYLRPDTSTDTITFEIGSDPPAGLDARRGYKRGTSGIFECAYCGSVTSRDYVAEQGATRGLGMAPTAAVVRRAGKRIYTDAPASIPDPDINPHDLEGLDVELAANPRDIWCRNFGLRRPMDLFTSRQLQTMLTLSDLISVTRERIVEDAALSAQNTDSAADDIGAYADAVVTYLAFAIDKHAEYGCTLVPWNATENRPKSVFTRQALPMVWDFCELNPFSDIGGSISASIEIVAGALTGVRPRGEAEVRQLEAAAVELPQGLISTDPPYYANVGYADLSDFFVVWLRRMLGTRYPELFSTLVAPKGDELVALAYRFDGDKALAETHFEERIGSAFQRMREAQIKDAPLTLYYAYKQAEVSGKDPVSTGWEVMLEALLKAGFVLDGTWPIRSERGGRMVSVGTNALASSIVLVCRARPDLAPLATRKELATALREELPIAIRRLQGGSIAPVDLAQAAVGPGMAIFSRYSKVVEADGKPMRVRTALALINDALDELLSEQEADFDADTRWCVAWFDQHGMNEGLFGVAETLSRAKNTAINGLVDAGIVHSRGGKVRLLARGELESTWDPASDTRLTVWEVTQHLISRHQSEGEEAAAALFRQLGGGLAEAARELAYHLFTICERKGGAQEALAYNALVAAWPEITRLAAQTPGGAAAVEQEAMEV